MKAKIKFYKPYKFTDGFRCTASKLIEVGLAEEIKEYPKKGLFLFRNANKVLQSSDIGLASKMSIIIVDSPWDFASKKLKELQRQKNRYYHFRKIPECFQPTNPFYKQKDPVYFSTTDYFSSAESLAIAYFVLGEKEKALKVLEILQYGHSFAELNKKCIMEYQKNIAIKNKARFQNSR